MKFLLFIFEFFNSAKNKNSRNQTSVMKVWCVNENVRNVNEKRMPTLKRKHDDLRLTASAPGQKKLASKPISRKAAKTEVSFNSFHYFRLLKWRAFDKIFRILGVYLFEETINRDMTQDKIPNFTIFREMGHLRHQISIINPCKILVL